MNASIETASETVIPAGRILVVDDDPMVAGMLGVALTSVGHEVIEVNSGEEALIRLEDTSGGLSPDIVILDIEMGGGIDGYETCRRLRALEATREMPVIFLSGHDSLEDRLRAYDAGGSDFMAKPFVPLEILRKARLAIAHNRRHEATMAEKRSSSDTAMIALTSLGDSEVTLKFSRGALGCRSLRALGSLTIESMASFGLNSQVQLRAPAITITMTAHGPASPLEESVFERSKGLGRMFSFGSRFIVNYDSVSLLVTNMPVTDEHLCGRIRDLAATIAEGAELAVENINLRTESVSRAEDLRKLADVSRSAVEDLRVSYRGLQVATRLELEAMAHTIEGLYVHLGLTDRQEFTISDTVRGAVDRVLTFFEDSSKLDSNFACIVEGLTKAGEYTVAQDDEVMPTVELW